MSAVDAWVYSMAHVAAYLHKFHNKSSKNVPPYAHISQNMYTRYSPHLPCLYHINKFTSSR